MLLVDGAVLLDDTVLPQKLVLNLLQGRECNRESSQDVERVLNSVGQSTGESLNNQ